MFCITGAKGPLGMEQEWLITEMARLGRVCPVEVAA